MSSLRIIFAGTPDFAARHLEHLLKDPQHELVAVYTMPDRPAGRGKRVTPSPVKVLANAHQVPVYQPSSFKDVDAQQQLAALNADLMVVVAYGLILPQVVLDTPRLGCINVHGSLLPKWRGAAPIQRAVCAGDVESGVTIMQMDAGMDTGPMLSKHKYTLTPDETSASLYERLAEIGPPALSDAINGLAQRTLIPIAQDNTQATLAAKITKEEAKINWMHSAVAIERCIRGFNPWPMAYCVLAEKNIKVWQAAVLETTSDKPAGEIIAVSAAGIDVATGEGVLRLCMLQFPGKKPMTAAQLLNGYGELLHVGKTFIPTMTTGVTS